MNRIVTISREFGSGGRELGKRLADTLNLPCYDQEIIEMIAEQHGFDKDYVAHISEKDLRAAYPLTIGHRLTPSFRVTDMSIQVAVTQQKIIQQFANQGDCVIVGRCDPAGTASYEFVYLCGSAVQAGAVCPEDAGGGKSFLFRPAAKNAAGR